MRIADFDLYKDLLYKESGLVLTPDKSYLLDSRLTPIARRWGFSHFDEMTMSLRAVPDTRLIRDIVEAMTTNETSFFRDIRPFENFEKLALPYMLDKRSKLRRMRIWCAACSSGQEPYSLGMILKENEMKWKGWTTEIVATDLSNEILDQAKKGIYSQFEVQRGLPVKYLMKYFAQEGEKWQLAEQIRKMIAFRQFNLLDDMLGLGSFDIIFCRNVLIYFDEKTKRGILERIASRLAPDGFLFLGGAETVIGITDAFKPLSTHRGVYVHHANPILLTDTAKATA